MMMEGGQRTRVLLVTQPTVGGAAQQVWQLASGLNARHFEVSVASPADGWLRERLLRHGGTHHPIGFVREISLLSDLRSIVALGRLVHEIRPDILHAHSSKAGILARWAGRRYRVPAVIYTPHGFAFLQASGWRRWLYLQLERLASPFADRLACVSVSEREAAVHHRVGRAEKIVVIPNGVDIPQTPEAGKGALKALLGVGPSCQVVAMVSRLSRPKQPEDLIRAAARLAESRTPSEVRFVFIGSGPLERPALSMVRSLGQESRVVFLGDRSDVLTLMADVDVFALATASEGMPFTLLEAMAAGKPVVGSRVPGIVDLVFDGLNGYTYPAGDAVELAKRLGELLRDERLRRRLGGEGKRRVEKEFTTERMLHETEEMYRAALGETLRT
jgi:glycosyltransferase involved in cell wall biosynthesis